MCDVCVVVRVPALVDTPIFTPFTAGLDVDENDDDDDDANVFRKWRLEMEKAGLIFRGKSPNSTTLAAIDRWKVGRNP
jgi:hypothetical protein